MSEADRHEAFLRSFLDPEDRGYLVNARVRDEIRAHMGMPAMEVRRLQEGGQKTDWGLNGAIEITRPPLRQ